MSDISQVKTGCLREGTGSSETPLELIERAVNLTKGITWPQAITITSIVGCFGYAAYLASGLIKEGYIKEIDMRQRRLVFTTA